MGVLRTSRSDPAAEPAPRSRQAVSPAPVLPAASLLGLQRTAGNAAVARYVNQLRRKPVEAIDATSDQFWDQLADAADKQLSSWLSFSFGGALNQFHRELTSGEAEDGTGSFVLDTCVTLLGFAGPQGEIAAAVTEIARGVYDQLSLDNPVDLTVFTRNSTNNAEALAKRIVDHDDSLELFRLLQEARLGEASGEPDSVGREVARGQVLDTISGLPTADQIGHAFTMDWIRSSKDGWDPGSDAGKIYVDVDLYEDEGAIARFAPPSIDDATLPGGVITALRNGFGADTRLELLPIELIANFTLFSSGQTGPLPPTSRWATLSNPGASGSELRAEPNWQRTAGDPELLDFWQRGRPYPTIGDLVPD